MCSRKVWGTFFEVAGNKQVRYEWFNMKRNKVIRIDEETHAKLKAYAGFNQVSQAEAIWRLLGQRPREVSPIVTGGKYPYVKLDVGESYTWSFADHSPRESALHIESMRVNQRRTGKKFQTQVIPGAVVITRIQ